MAEPAHDIVEVPVGANGSLVVPASELAEHGIGAGEIVRIQVVRRPRRRSRLGAHRRDLGFTQDHLDELRAEMGDGIGEDLAR
ncbi:MAG: hypothetical protein ABIW46_08665 [Acidimicrobiales bacterium]